MNSDKPLLTLILAIINHYWPLLLTATMKHYYEPFLTIVNPYQPIINHYNRQRDYAQNRSEAFEVAGVVGDGPSHTAGAGKVWQRPTTSGWL